MSFLGRTFRYESRKSELSEELRSHLEMAVADRIAGGESPAEARAAAQREFGNVPLVEDVTRATWGWLWLERILQDVAYAFRQFRRAPGFAASVIGTLALGIAAATAMFTVVDHVLLRPLPYRDADRLVAINQFEPKSQLHFGGLWQDIEQWEARSKSIEQFALFARLDGSNFLSKDTTAIQISGVRISANLFTTLDVEPSLGRNFALGSISSDAGTNSGAIILSDTVWRQVYGADPSILGKSVAINKTAYTVIGVMPAGFVFPANPRSPQVWVPLTLGKFDRSRDYTSSSYDVIGRLRPGVSVKSANAEIGTIQKSLLSNYKDSGIREQRSDARAQSYSDSLVDASLRKALLALLAASGVLWLIAAVNATNLLLARSAARQREIAMRGALGASRWRIVQQFLIEGVILSSAATLLGTAIALTAVRLSRSVVPKHLDVDLSIHVNFAILAVLCGLTILTAVASSIWPALLAVRVPIEPALKQGSLQSGIGRRHKRIRSLLVAIEVAMSLTLLMSCGLLLRTIYTLRHVPLGFRTDHVIVANLTPPTYRFSGQNIVVNLYQPLLDRVKHIDGVQAAGLMSEVPLGQSFRMELTMAMSAVKGGPANRSFASSLKSVTPDTQRIFGFPMLAGRFFNDSDTAKSQPVVVVNRALAELYSPGSKDLSAIIGHEMMGRTVIGVLNDQRQTKVAEPSRPEVEICLLQLTPDNGLYQPSTIAMDLAVRTSRAPAAVIPELRAILGQAAPELVNANFTTMEQIAEDSYGSQRLAAHLLEFFAASALLLSVAGIYGLLAWIVAQRMREMGVRIALGARRGNLLWLVLRQAGFMLFIGIAAGMALAWSSARLLADFLYGVSARDGWTLAAAASLLFASGMVAAWLPARRAAHADPMQALRAE